MATRRFTQVAYGLSQPLINENPQFIYAKRNPTTSDFGIPSTIWINSLTSTIYILAVVANNSATWVQVQAGGGAGVFSSLTVTPGPISLTGTTTINTAGAAVTTIGTGGTGAVNIGNATGNTAVTGSLSTTTTITAGTGLTVTAGGATITGTTNINTAGAAVTTIGTGGTGAVNIGNATGNTAVTGSLNATTGLSTTNGNVTLGNAANHFLFQNGVGIYSGTGDPNGVLAAAEGSLYLNTNGTGVGDRAWINTNSGNVWTAITTAT
jgi:hypothetical protein